MDSHLLQKMQNEVERHCGRVAFYNQAKRWGFITPDEGGDDAWFHASFVLDSGIASTGRRVSYVLKDGGMRGRRRQAMEVRVLDD
jgi:CspA family cold shock protein